MKLDRNLNDSGRGKYGLIKNRELRLCLLKAANGGDAVVEEAAEIVKAVALLERVGIIDWGTTPETEFFVMRLKDSAASAGLRSYASVARNFDPEYANEVTDLANRAGPYHPNCKRPD